MAKKISSQVLLLTFLLLLNFILCESSQPTATQQHQHQQHQQSINTKNRLLQQDNISPEQDKAIQKLADSLIELITKYDTSGSGFIKKSIYPQFLTQVFLKGTFGDRMGEYQYSSLLLEAASKFTESKETQHDTISVQEFYDDIVTKFTLFLIDNEKYKIVLDTLFEDLDPSKDKDKDKKDKSNRKGKGKPNNKNKEKQVKQGEEQKQKENENEKEEQMEL